MVPIEYFGYTANQIFGVFFVVFLMVWGVYCWAKSLDERKGN